MAYLQGSCPIVKKRQLTPTIFDFTLSCPQMAQQAQPGQFLHVKVDGFSLRRPISICRIGKEESTLRMVFEVRGEGTAALSQLREGDQVDLIGPLGNGFPLLSPDKKVVVVGGGIGVPPMLETAARYGSNATAIIGFRNQGAVILEDEFRALGCDTRLATDDGSAGFHGFVTQLLDQRLQEGKPDLICACGPAGMLKGVVKLAQEAQVPCKISLEERMGCGVGACLVCACKTVKDGREIFSHVCKDGPVFDGNEVVLE